MFKSIKKELIKQYVKVILWIADNKRKKDMKKYLDKL